VENKAVANLLVVQSDGTTRTVSRIALDPMSGAAFLTTNASGLSVVRFVTDNSLTAGDRVGFLGAGVDGSPYFAASFVSGFERTSDGPNSSDAVSRVLPIEPTTGLLPGQAVLTLSGDMAGMWDGVSVIPGSVLSEAVTSLVQNQGQVIRPVFGFSYAVSSSIPAKASGKVAGLLVTPQEGLKTAVVAGSAAQKAGLAMGDIIVKIGDVDLAATRVPDAVLAAQKPGATVTFVVQRAGSTVNLSLVPAASGSMAK
jgi:S1-C subfamily serine protease